MGLTLIVPDWPAPANVKAFSTTRSGGVSSGSWSSLNLGLMSGDQPESVLRNRQLLGPYVPSPIQWLKQVHGTTVARHTGVIRQDLEADALITDHPARVCAVLTADCLPVLLCDRNGRQVAVAHAGWRGLAGGVLQAVVKQFQAPSAELMAWMGPAIGPSAYEVGEDVLSSFPNHLSACFSPRGDRWMLDLYRAARCVLGESGVPLVLGGDYCTFQDEERFYSYRREGVTGRMASLIWLDA